jgi:hypothetical protein
VIVESIGRLSRASSRGRTARVDLRGAECRLSNRWYLNIDGPYI